ncbi:DNA repair protein rad51d [Coemansia sp. RSA 2559]|nr:DNA repair protein rad51d [Coemansia sp. RSA 2559]KAJ2869154.1 DNA repair protein rad51d [Coemansia erecta]
MPYLESAKYIKQWAEHLQSSHDPGTEEFPYEQCLAALKNIGVQTDYDLVIRFDVLPETPAPLHRHIKALRMAVLEHFASPGRTAADMLDSSNKGVLDKDGYPLYIKSGIDGLDDLLSGGLRIGHVTELCGKSGSGKTQLAIEFAVSHLVSTNTQSCASKVYYLQSSPLPLWRVEDVLNARLSRCELSSDRDSMFQKAMEHLVIVDCYNTDSLLSFLYSYSANLACPGNDAERGTTSSDLVIIDSVRPLVINASAAYNNRYILIHTIRTALRSICAASRPLRSAAILIINGISQRGLSESNDMAETRRSSSVPVWPLNIQPSLGFSWAQISHTHVLLSLEDHLQYDKTKEGSVGAGAHGKASVMILKSTHLASGKSRILSIL